MIKKIDKNKAKLVVDVGTGTQRRRKSKTVTYTGKKDLERQYREFEAECQRPDYSDITVDQLIQDYISDKKAMGIKPTTLNGYNICSERLSAFCGREKAKEVQPYLLQSFVVSAADKWHPKTIRNTMGLLSAAYNRAIQLDLLESNPCNRIILPKNIQPDIKTFSEPELFEFLDVIREDELMDFTVGCELCLLCGLRRSEMLGLRESDIDLERGTMSVHQTRHKIKGERYILDTKTVKSTRVLALPDLLINDIANLMALHASYDFYHTDYLIQNGFGEEMSASAFSHRLERTEDKYGLPRITAHGLRHTFATMLNADGVDIARISAELGHSNITTTLNKYTHVFGGASASSHEIAKGINNKLDKSKK